MSPPDAVQIRVATRDDAPAIAAMFSAMMLEIERVGGRAVADSEAREQFFAESYATGIDDPEHRYLVAEQSDGTVIGAAAGDIRNMPPLFEPASSMHVSAVYVTPDERGRGVGTKLVRSLLDWGRERGCTEADLNVIPGNPAQAIYEKMGFEVAQFRMKRHL